MIVLLNRDYLREQFLPALIARYFASGSGEPEYVATVVSQRDPAQLIYASDSRAQSERASSSSDAAIGLFSLRMDFIQAVPFTPAFEAQAVPLQTAEITTFTASAQAPASGVMFFGNQPAGLWQLRVRHRAGSLEAAVASLRRRNLFISFSALLLLAASMAIVYSSAQRARRLARQQIEFVAGVSHELRLPVSVVCMASANLADGMIRNPEQVAQYGNLIRTAGRRLSHTIEQVLDFAGTEMLRKPYRMVPLDVKNVIESSLAICEPDLQTGGYRIEREIAPNLPPLHADGAALERAIQNLLGNAMKYGGESRAIKIRAGAFATRQGREIQITVEDRGLGIDASDLPRIFDPFSRGRAAIASQIPGNGLGLHLVKRVMEAHGGRVSVRSALGEGSAFTLHLPIREQEGEDQIVIHESEEARVADRGRDGGCDPLDRPAAV